MDLEAQVANFKETGYLVLPGLLPGTLVERLAREVDEWVDSGLRQLSIDACLRPEECAPPSVVELRMEAHGELAAYAPLLELLSDDSLLGPSFVFHHLHSDRRPPGGSGKNWHHDYEQRPQRDRDQPMIHTLHYIGGLQPTVGSLAVLPGSHHLVAEKDAWTHLGTAAQPGEVLIEELPPGSTVLLHSALFHTRRAAPGPTAGGGPRYMIDASYCRTGTLWPPVKPYWREVLSVGRERGLGQGRWPELFADRHFSEYVRTGTGTSA
ncbi:phytanoyl-CoA dioxygenase family protein [Streptomyces sp. BE308]|uniref:phytanoyl-CoA dioxygenase family protein n=1 Tax=unclassified Streptomyces TaxID=2593676 RepID=UPI002DD9A931|nr:MULTISPECIES: phytanoyl-CoA dioxygenase family protein [unclassified Streptomyces]MEE1795560.1 phytanoyl-CoA dioxygenase family protein [Streptomyces sp. BE308]WRZ70656.1 phytanoyl-CoA dioxygenase family protein [Streptomyces sp. NBC_01237]